VTSLVGSVIFSVIPLKRWPIIDESRVWDVIKTAKSKSSTDKELRVELTRCLALWSVAELRSYAETYLGLIDQANTAELNDAIWLINESLGDDSWFDFRDYIVSRGQKRFYEILNDPESLLDDQLNEYNEWTYEEFHFHSCAEDAYRAQIGDEYATLEIRHNWSDGTGVGINTDDDVQVKRAFPRIWQWRQSLANAE